jgi:hypothetical protein
MIGLLYLESLPVSLLQVIQPGRSGVGGCAVGTWRHRNYDVRALLIVEALVVETFYAQQHLLFLQAELRSLADGQKHGMLLIAGTDSVSHLVGLQNIFLAYRLLRLLATGIGALHFAGGAALHGIHLLDISGLVRLGIFGIGRRGHAQNYT